MIIDKTTKINLNLNFSCSFFTNSLWYRGQDVKLHPIEYGSITETFLCTSIPRTKCSKLFVVV